MTKFERFQKRLQQPKYGWLRDNLKKNQYYNQEQFYKDCLRYVKAIKEGRVVCSIGSVSSSGMSRTIKFVECMKHKDSYRYSYWNFYAFFLALGYKQAKERDFFRIHGCGMDMIFHTNYTNIHYMRNLGIITEKQCNHLAQQTPTVI